MKKAILPAEIELGLIPSKILWGYLAVFSILCLVCLCITVVWPWSIVLATLFGLSLRQVRQRFWGRGRLLLLRVDVYGQMTLVLQTDDTWQTDGIWQVNVLPDSIVHRFGMVLHVHYVEPTEAYSQTVSQRAGLLYVSRLLAWRQSLPTRILLLPDQASAQAWRALLVWLRWGHALADGSGPGR